MLVTTKLLIDLQRHTYPQVVNAVQGDQNTRSLEICLFSSGTAWTVPEGVTAAMRYCKPDKTKGYYDTMPDGTSAWSVKENVITMLLAPQMLTVAGTVLAQVEMILGSSVVATFTMQINVAENPAAGVLVSENYVNWLQWMETELESRMNEMLESGELIGPPGPAGTPVTILSQSVEYQASADYKTEPTGEWTTTIPDVAQGEYLWTRTMVVYNSGESVVSYSVARFGRDGAGSVGTAGSVSTVCGVAPEANGNVQLTAENVDALSIKGGTMEGPINMNGQKLSGLNAPTEDDEAATKEYVDTSKKNAETYAETAIAKASTPHNYLDNSDFSNPINQRGETSYGASTASVYTIDRWKKDLSGTVTVADGYITLTAENNGFYQILPSDLLNRLTGKKSTFAAMVKSESQGATISVGIGSGGGYEAFEVPSEWTIILHYNTYDYTNYPSRNNFVFRANGSVHIKWAALYEGEYTAETLPKYQPKGYGAELAECQRYYLHEIGGGTGIVTSTFMTLSLPIPMKMRIAPSVLNLTISTIRVNGNSVTPTAIEYSGMCDNRVSLRASYASGAAGDNNHVGMWLGSCSLSADL